MGWFTDLFKDNLVVRFEAVTYDGNHLTGKFEVTSFAATKEDIEEYLKGVMYVEKGVRRKTFTITGLYRK
jgi:hypothetical protein